MVPLSKEEKETIILWNQESDTVDITTFEDSHIKRLKRLAKKYPEVFNITIDKRYGCIDCTFPKKLLRICYCEPLSDEELLRKSELAKKRNVISRIRKE